MRYLRLALLPLVFAACTDAGTSLDQTPQFDFANAPDFSGIVERSDGYAAYTWADPATGWRVTFGLDMLEYCDGIVDFDLLYWADKNIPNDPDRIVSLNKMEARTAVWPFLDFDCALFTSVDPLASGMSTFYYIDNDILGSTSANTNSWGFMASGTLAWTADGSPAQFSFVRRLVWKKDEPARVVAQKLVLR
jgi:hypothetical protein